MKTIGIIGSRRRNENSDLRSCIEVFKTVYKKGDKIVSGGCPQGGDRFAEVIGKSTEEVQVSKGMDILQRIPMF